MTKKDFELIAQTIKALVAPSFEENSQGLFDAEARGFVAWRFAEALRATNPRFNAERFLKACGVAP